ncbi:MAG: ATP-binding cassette domain-containing protein [Clostridiales bacterium]|nr:ATP-binding cassette domain-containing protein [Clostridiales bacterium]
MAQIELNDVRKTYRVAERQAGLAGALKGAFRRQTRTVRAVDGISFAVEAGELVGYIGPNGAGKSTTVKLMSGILTPDGGGIRVLGRVPHQKRQEHVRHIGVVFGQRSQLWWDTPVRDSFELLRDIYRVKDADYRRRLSDLTDLLDAGELLAVPVRQLSLDQRMRCELIASLLHAPEILFLDEPTIGLDAVTKLGLRRFLVELNRQGVTMILTTHDMDDIEALCTRVMAIGRGRLLFDGRMADMRARFAPHRVLKARMAADCPPIEIALAERVEHVGRDVRVTFLPDRLPAERAIAMLAAACPVADLTVEAPDVEELVADMYRELKL